MSILPIIDPLDVREFVNIDDQIGVGESATIDDIVEVMNEQDGCESEEEDREMEVKTNDAIIGLDNVVKYTVDLLYSHLLYSHIDL